MAKKTPKPTPDADAPDAAAEEAVVELEYIGPVGQESPTFGPLVVGQRYQASVSFADYLVERHPDYWQRPA